MARGTGLTLGFDIGTTSSKAVVLDERSRRVAGARVEHSVDYPRAGFVEQDARVWLTDIQRLTALLSRTIDLGRIAAVGVSSMGPNVLPVSDAGEPLRPAILYGVDTRAVRQIERMNSALQGAAASRVFTKFSSQSILPKILWVRENEPDVFANARSFLSTSGYVVRCLTGCAATDFFTASAGTLVDFTRSALFAESFDEAGIDIALIPGLRWPAEIAGYVTPEGAERSGLPRGIPVTVGTTDAAAESLVCGCTAPGAGAISLGGTTIFVACSDVVKSLQNIYVSSSLSPGRYIFGGATGSGGLLVEWFARSVLRMSGTEELMASFPGLSFRPTGVFVLPYLNGARTPLNDPCARGLLTGLTPTTGAEEIFLALLESLAFDLSLIVSEIESSGVQVDRIRVSGGGTRSPVLLQVISEVLRRDLESLGPEAGAAFGAALLARAALEGASLDEIGGGVPVDARARYSGRFDSYLEEKKGMFLDLYRANKQAFARMGRTGL